ncbi:MAG: NAD(P)H-dependent oxidoreductase subunit E [Nitriliruptoraceae bacterium]
MDLRIADDQPTEVERDAIESVAGPSGATVADGRVVVRDRDLRHLLLPALAEVQSRVGWVSRGAMAEICRRLHVPPADAYGVATFYALISTEERPGRVAHVCDDIACAPAGGEALADALVKALGASPGYAVHRSPCLGQCDRAPAVYLQRAAVDDDVVVHATVDDVVARLDATGTAAPETASVTPGRLLDRLRDAAASDFAALRAARAMGPGAVIDAVRDSGLVGRGGASFPTGIKWAAVAAAAGPRHLICNADESEPGTFKDRVLLESAPAAVIESMAIAGTAIGAEHGWVYIRGEYPVATRALHDAIADARARGALGDDVLGSGLRFDIEVRRGQGAYICGEETALMESIEGHRGEPRNKPPFPTTHGLFGRPTVINNVETLCNVLDIVHGGTPDSRLFCLSGDVARPGVIEAPLGTPLRELLDDAGARTDDLRAVLLGGAAGSFVGPDLFDLPLDVESARAHGLGLGSGVVMALGPDSDVARVVTRIAQFFRDESCGQCVPCRVGVVRQQEALGRYLDGGRAREELTLLRDVDRVMTDASICGLGQTAASAIRSAIALELV